MNTVTDVVELAGAWCVTAAGVGAVAALGAVADRISAIRPHPTIACPDGADGAAMVPAMYAPWEDMPDNVALQQRFLTLIDAACRDIGADSDAEGSFAGRGRVFLLLPSAGSARGRQLDVEAIRRAFTEALPGRAHAEVTVRAAEEGVTAVVAGELAGISSGTLDWILIGAVDSLIDPVTLLELLRDDKLRLRGKGGVVPGEACAFALFRRVVTGTKAPVITLTSMATAGEPNHGRADEAAMRGLGEAIGAASSGSGLDVRQCDHVFADLRDDADGELEWWQTTRALWRVTIPERYRRAVAQGVIAAPEAVNAVPPLTRIGDALGDVGGAALFVQLAVSAEWRRFNDSWSRFGLGTPFHHWLICETAAGNVRGALCMTDA